MQYIIAVFLAFAAFESMAQESGCANVPYSKSNLFRTLAEVEGPRGSLKFPVIIDTGASQTLIPESIMKGIGYTSQGKSNFSVAGGEKSFEKGTVKSLTFAGINLGSAVVYVEKSRQDGSLRLNPCYKNGRFIFDCKEDKSKEEYGIIGMSELSQTSFEYKNGVMKICKNQEN